LVGAATNEIARVLNVWPKITTAICRELLARGNDSPAKLWPETSAQLERQKFQADLAQLFDKDVSLLRTLAAAQQDEFNPTPFAVQALLPTFPRLPPTNTTVFE
jgi:hypothetical protein